MANTRSSEYRQRLQLIKESFSAQAKELAMPVAIDLTSTLAGWWLGRQIGRASLAIGLVTYAGGKFHSLHEAIDREERQAAGYDENNRALLSGYNPLYKDEERFYHGESPLVHLGMGMMLGGAFAQSAMNGVNGEPLSAIEKAKTSFTDIAADLKYRLYLDKIFGDKKGESSNDNSETDKGVSGVDEIDVFLAEGKKELDMSRFDDYDRRIQKSAEDFQNKKNAPAKAAAVKTPAEDKNKTEDDEMEAISGWRII